MRIVTAKDYDQMSRKASYIVASRVILNPKCVLGLATGDTPKGLYNELVRLFRAGDVDFSGVTTFNLDEYAGLSPENPQSYHSYMEEHLFRHINIPPEHRHIPNGAAQNIGAECRRYEELIEQAHGIDLQILGLGRDGHIGFNEPDVKFEKGTHHVRLTQSTIEANARFFENRDEVPKSAISMGIKTIMSARRILLLASGPEKAEAIRGAVMGAVTPDLPASVLQLHPNATLIVDEAASAEIMRIK
ncbi:MAG TPA: glucosamine-6-phosphate deaminase [Aminobacteriaceae bacterium]|nr:glucosamine-6-phosphate deaminase [Synergistaceae bacterium]HOO88409.1 glucosamine-6-phosphate deaminase [Synergistales bacterium]HRV97395.1 glucosamine-6-phosphate deaminase [Aminobacteriaceae bacterium]